MEQREHRDFWQASMHRHDSHKQVGAPLWGVLATTLLIVIATIGNPPPRPRSDSSKLRRITTPTRDVGLPSTKQLLLRADPQAAGILRFSPNDRYLAAIYFSINPESRGEARVMVLDLKSQKALVDVSAYSLVLVGFSALSDEVAIYSPQSRKEFKDYRDSRGAVTLYRLTDGRPRETIEITKPGDWRSVAAIGIADDGQSVAALLDGRSLQPQAWSLETKDPIPVDRRRFLWSGYNLSSNAQLRGVGGFPGPAVRIIQLNPPDRRGYCFGNTSPSTESAFTDDCRMWAAAYQDGKFIVWDIREEEGRPIVEKDGFENCTAFAISHDLKRLAVAETDGTIHLQTLKIPPLK